MGAPMARHLAGRHDVVVWNRTAAKAQGLGATVAGSPAEAVDGADVVVTMLSDGPAVARVMDGITLGAEQLWWQASTVGVEWIGTLGDRLVDGPVLGTRQPAEQGEPVDDIVEPAIEKAIDQSASAMVVRHHDDLVPLGGIGAVLRV